MTVTDPLLLKWQSVYLLKVTVLHMSCKTHVKINLSLSDPVFILLMLRRFQNHNLSCFNCKGCLKSKDPKSVIHNCSINTEEAVQDLKLSETPNRILVFCLSFFTFRGEVELTPNLLRFFYLDFFPKPKYQNKFSNIN